MWEAHRTEGEKRNRGFASQAGLLVYLKLVSRQKRKSLGQAAVGVTAPMGPTKENPVKAPTKPMKETKHLVVSCWYPGGILEVWRPGGIRAVSWRHP